jgi:hypothetical protein
MRNPHAGEPFDTPDEEIAEALLDVSIPTLLLSLVHMSGDPELIRGRLRPAGLFLNEVQGYMTEEDKAEARALALEVIRDYRDRGCPEPEPISSELLHEMMTWLVCEEVPEEYVPLLLEEMELDGRDARRVDPVGTPGSPAYWPVSGSKRRASRSPSSRRTPGSAEPGGRTPTPGPGSTSETTSTATRSSRATTGPSTSPDSPSCSGTSSR